MIRIEGANTSLGLLGFDGSEFLTVLGSDRMPGLGLVFPVIETVFEAGAGEVLEFGPEEGFGVADALIVGEGPDFLEEVFEEEFSLHRANVLIEFFIQVFLNRVNDRVQVFIGNFKSHPMFWSCDPPKVQLGSVWGYS